ncbi:MAG TPA: polysaccharide biosynthesis/export family protein, partial [Acidobacteriaceae bacterium]|nr:polysaccharide biosynthesis/export family protein [Acidobacteriaceae bacterium]
MTSPGSAPFSHSVKLGVILALFLGNWFSNAGSIAAQTTQPSPSSSALLGPAGPADTADSTSNSMADATDRSAPVATSHTALTAGEILMVLQEKPEVVIELKSVMADTLEQQGVSIQADSITDEMLYNQINSNSQVRADITSFLRARGYISEDDLQRYALASQTGDETSVSMQTLAQIPRTSPSASDFSRNAINGPVSAESKPSSASIFGNAESAPIAEGSATSSAQNKSEKNARNITAAPQGLHLPTPYNLLSLRDLYTQIPIQTDHLKRFGSDVFLNRNPSSANRLGGATSFPPLDAPIGPDYVVGPGDSLTIDIWGSVSQTVTRVISRDGRITLPEAGDLQVAGRTLKDTRNVIEKALQQQFRNVKISVTVSQLRAVRVYVVGDVQRPGAYEISSLSSPLSALYAAGGPTAVGSLRILRHYRGKVLLGDIDLYDFLLHGIRDGDDGLQGGDTLLVPPVGPQVAVSGAVKRPAIYELKGATSMQELLEDAGGVTVAAALGHITVDRIKANQLRETVSLDMAPSGDPAAARAAIATFPVKDGDRVHVAPILPYSERVIYLEGHVVRPGRLPYHDGMRLNEVLSSYQDVLPEPATVGEIIRLMPPDLHPVTINF